MESTSEKLFEGVIVMLALIGMAWMLRRLGVVKRTDSSLFSQLVLNVSLPVLIFSALVVKQINPGLLLEAAVIAVVELMALALAWVVARLFHFDRDETGALLLSSGFGAAALLGFPLIMEVFPGNPVALDDATIINMFGIGLLTFILGPIIGSYYGMKDKHEKHIVVHALKEFFFSPIFVSIVLGIVVSLIPIRHGTRTLEILNQILTHIGGANTFLVALAIGTMLEFRRDKHLLVFILSVIVIKLALMPLTTELISQMLHLDDLRSEILLIEAAMPTAAVSAIYAHKYDCKPGFVTSSILITLVISLISVTFYFGIFF